MSDTIRLIIYILLIFIFVAIVLYVSLKKKAEVYQPSPTYFLSLAQTKDFLLADSDGYGAGLNKVNLEANGVVKYGDLIDKWQSAAGEWKDWERKKLQDAATVADFHINTKLKDAFKVQLASIGWQFAKTLHPYVCDGLPFTRTDIIFLTDKVVADSSIKRLAKILVHEKVHVWERKYPEEMQGWIERNGFQKVRPTYQDPLVRANPDVDSWNYIDKNWCRKSN
jgi:hypothetical protein